jgi:hypothetical protein
MRSNRLALLAVLAGSALLGSASAGVKAIGGVAASASTTSVVQHHGDHPDGHRGEPGL